MIEAVFMLLSALALTIAVECVVAWAAGLRGANLRVVIWLNLITNPVLNYLLIVNRHYGIIDITWGLVAGLETGVVILEWLGLVHVLGLDKWKMLALALAMNGGSFLAGWLIFH